MVRSEPSSTSTQTSLAEATSNLRSRSTAASRHSTKGAKEEYVVSNRGTGLSFSDCQIGTGREIGGVCSRVSSRIEQDRERYASEQGRTELTLTSDSRA